MNYPNSVRAEGKDEVDGNIFLTAAVLAGISWAIISGMHKYLSDEKADQSAPVQVKAGLLPTISGDEGNE